MSTLLLDHDHDPRISARRRRTMVAATAAVAVVLCGATASAQTASPSARATASDKVIRDFWTAQRILAAEPIATIPGPDHRTTPLAAESGGEKEISVSAVAPTMGDDPSLFKRVHPPVEGRSGATATSSGEVEPYNAGTTGAYFTTARVTPDAAVSSWPHRIAGRLLAFNPVSHASLTCSAAVVRPRLVVTAGQCVHHAGPTADDKTNNRYFYTNFIFIPAYADGAAPLGTWTYAWVIASSTWTDGGGTLPNAQDIALLEMNDRNGTRIAAYTGSLGYATAGLSQNHLTILGYPCNIDSCTRMQATGAGAFGGGGNNTVIYGSAQGGGATGGPWIQDFGVAGSGSAAGTGRNMLRSVSSYGPSTTGPLYVGGSILQGSGTGSFLSIMTTACAHRSGNC
mgnify:CR=1 FL=1